MLAKIYNKKELATVFLIYCVILIKSLYASRFGFGLVDEGEYLHIGLRILKGDVPYNDFFSYLPPLYDYWNAFAFKLFDISVFSPRLLNSIIFSFVPVLYYLVVRRFSSSFIALLISLSLGFMEAGMERLYYHIFTFSALFCYFSFLKNAKRVVGLLVGILLGITSLFRLDVGLQFLFGLIIATIIYQINNSRKWLYASIKQLTTILVGFLIPVTGLLYWLISHSLLQQFIQSAILVPSKLLPSYTLPFPKPWDIFPRAAAPKEMFTSYEAFFAYLIILVYLCAAYQVARNWKNIWRNAPELPTFLLIAIFTTPYIFSRPDLGHMVKGGIPAFFAAAFILEKYKLAKHFLIIPMVLVFVGIAQIIWWTRFFDTTIETPKGSIRTNSRGLAGTTFVSASTIEKSLEFIDNNTSPGEQILAVPYVAGLYFLSNRPSESYTGNIFYSYVQNEEKFVDELRLLDLKVVIYDTNNGSPGKLKRLSDYYPLIHHYIIENFRVEKETPEGWLFMVKKF